MTQPLESNSRRRFIRTAVAGAVVLPIAGSLLRPEFMQRHACVKRFPRNRTVPNSVREPFVARRRCHRKRQ